MKLRKSKATKILCVALALLAFTLTACSSAAPRGLKKEPEQGGGQESRREDERGQEEDGLAGGEDGKKQATEEVRNPGQDDAVRDGESYERGTVNRNVYESKWLGIRLSLSDFGDTSEVEIAGTTYTKMPITTAVQGISANIDMYMRVKDGHAALITITYLPEQSAKVEELIGSIQKY